MATAEITEILAVDKDVLYAVVTKYEDYPKFVEGCTSVRVERKGPEAARVAYHVSMIKDVTYTLDHHEDPGAGIVEWNLVESDFFKKNVGRWRIKAMGPGKCEAHYELEVEFKIPVPGMILNRLVKGSLPSMIKSFEKEARRRASNV